MSPIDHLDLVVTSLERSLAFYRGLLEPLGYVRVSEIEGERGERVVYLGRIGGMGSVSLREAQSDAHPVPYDRYAVGLHHLALSASSRSAVDERAEWLRAREAQIESGPQEYGYTPGYYAVFFYDPDGIKLELVHRPAERATSSTRSGASRCGSSASNGIAPERLVHRCPRSGAIAAPGGLFPPGTHREPPRSDVALHVLVVFGIVEILVVVAFTRLVAGDVVALQRREHETRGHLVGRVVLDVEELDAVRFEVGRFERCLDLLQRDRIVTEHLVGRCPKL
ncbi:MAG: VOC family protein [Solirubrobacteraceae bacterium]